MSRFTRFARSHAPACCCGQCAELDLRYPGEGRQLALALPPAPGRTPAVVLTKDA